MDISKHDLRVLDDGINELTMALERFLILKASYNNIEISLDSEIKLQEYYEELCCMFAELEPDFMSAYNTLKPLIKSYTENEQKASEID